MISGLNQEVDIFGRTFHFQTELTGEDELYIRTEVFVGGKIVASRESRLGWARGDRLDEDAVRTMMKRQHSQILKGVRERAQRYQERKHEGTKAESQAAAASWPEEKVDAPSEEMKAAAQSSMRIRWMFGKLRLRIGLANEPGDDMVERLEKAERGFSWIIQMPTFPDVRMDEQIRCHLIKDRIERWFEGERDAEYASKIWSEIVTFNDYLSEVNKRAELVAFDRRQIRWALGELRRGESLEKIMPPLQLLFGLDTELDKLLDKSVEVPRESWIAHLRRVLTLLPLA